MFINIPLRETDAAIRIAQEVYKNLNKHNLLISQEKAQTYYEGCHGTLPNLRTIFVHNLV